MALAHEWFGRLLFGTDREDALRHNAAGAVLERRDFACGETRTPLRYLGLTAGLSGINGSQADGHRITATACDVATDSKSQGVRSA
ncbi:hypothetical protein, partial [Streptomyces sp. NPDC005167]